MKKNTSEILNKFIPHPNPGLKFFYSPFYFSEYE